MSAHPHTERTRALIATRAAAAWAERHDEILRKRRETIARLSVRPVDAVKQAPQLSQRTNR
jgi:hypothetical protein